MRVWFSFLLSVKTQFKSWVLFTKWQSAGNQTLINDVSIWQDLFCVHLHHVLLSRGAETHTVSHTVWSSFDQKHIQFKNQSCLISEPEPIKAAASTDCAAVQAKTHNVKKLFNKFKKSNWLCLRRCVSVSFPSEPPHPHCWLVSAADR